MKFVSNRNITIATKFGHAIRFEKGVPVFVPYECRQEVLMRGCVPAEGEAEDAGISLGDAPERVAEPVSNEERDAKIEEVVRHIIARNNSRDFTAAGTPSAQTVSTKLGWKVDQKEVRKVWERIRPGIMGLANAEE